MDKKSVLESDKRLLQFRTYDAYLDSLISKIDVCYFRNYLTARKIAELGYRSTGDMLSKEEFYRKLADVMETLFPTKKPYELCSYGMTSKDILLNELANRERNNRIGLVAQPPLFLVRDDGTGNRSVLPGGFNRIKYFNHFQLTAVDSGRIEIHGCWDRCEYEKRSPVLTVCSASIIARANPLNNEGENSDKRNYNWDAVAQMCMQLKKQQVRRQGDPGKVFFQSD